MADYKRIRMLIDGIIRGVDLSVNTLVLGNVKIGGETNYATFNVSSVSGEKTITMPNANVDLGDIATNASSISTHTNGGSSKHDGSEIDFEYADGSKKNIQASSDDVENALIDLDTAIGALAASPSNYTPSNAAIIADHLAAIDSALSTAGSNEFDDASFKIIDSDGDSLGIVFDVSAVTTADKTITVPDANVDLGDIATNASEIDDLEAALGSSTGLAGMDYTSTNYVTVDTTAVAAISALDSQVKTNADAISSLSSATYFKGSATSFADLNPASIGDYFVVTSAFSTVNVGDHLIAKSVISSDPTDLSDFAIVDNTEASDIVRTGDTETVTNAMLAGSIADSKLVEDYIKTSEVDDSSIEFSGSSLNVKALGITNAMLAGSIATSKLADSSEIGEAVTFFGSTDLSAAEAETLSDGSNADSLHEHAIISKVFVAGEAFSGTATSTTYAVRKSVSGETDGRVYKADDDASSNDNFHVIGLAYVTADIAAGENIDVVILGEITSSVAFTGSQDEGKAVFLGDSGAITLSPSSSVNDANVKVGVVSLVGAAGTAKILVNGIQVMGVN